MDHHNSVFSVLLGPPCEMRHFVVHAWGGIDIEIQLGVIHTGLYEHGPSQQRLFGLSRTTL